MSSRSQIKNPMLERQITGARAIVAGLGLLVLLGVLTWRMTHLQIVRHDEFATRSDNNRMRMRIMAPERGAIFDRNGVKLAENLETYQLEIIPEQVDNLEDTVLALAEIIEITDRERELFYERADKQPSFRSIPLKSRMSFAEVARFGADRHKFEGVEMHAALTRRYPLGEYAAHVVGYVGSITQRDLEQLDERRYRGTQRVGKVGVEAGLESLLHGDPGSKIIEANAQGRALRDLEYKPPMPGQDVYLTIDAVTQRAAVEAMGDRTGSVVAIAPGSGDVLALVSQPSFDPHLFVDGIDYVTYASLNANPGRPLFNRAIAGQYPPGSTIKPVMALSGLDAGTTTPRKRELCIGHFVLPNNERRYRDWKRSGHGFVNLHDAVAESCDIYFYQLAVDMGVDRIHSFLSRFGLGDTLGLDIPGEKRGLLPSRDWKRRVRREAWYPGETVNIGIGQGFMTTTPIQLAHMTALLATRGQSQTPRLLYATADPQTGDITAAQREPGTTISLDNPDHWELVLDSMEAVTHAPNGTAQKIGLDSAYRMAGKTGTAQVAGLSQEDEDAPELDDVAYELRDHALFVGFAPRHNPQIAVAVVAEHSGSGGRVAAPIARAVMDAFLTGRAGADSPERSASAADWEYDIVALDMHGDHSR